MPSPLISRYAPLLLLTGVLLASCGSYRQNILFQVDAANLEQQTREAESNYVIRANDLLTLSVYTNQGEKIIDPNRESFSDQSSTLPATPASYLVNVDGITRFPLIDPINIEGLTLRQAQEMLGKEYDRFYHDAFVVLGFTNKRVVVLGSPGGKVIPLSNENMRLTEVLALAEGIGADGRANNIRVIRGDAVMVVDFSTFAGYQRGNLVMQPGDIVYVEPVRRPFIEGMRDYAPMISVISSLATLIFVISQ